MEKIIRFLRQIFYLRYEHEKDNQRLLVVFFLMFSLALSLLELNIVTDAIYQTILYGFSGLLLLSLVFATRNILLPGRIVASVAGFAVITVFVYINGTHDVTVDGYYLILIAGGLLIGDTGLILLGALSAVAIVGIGFAEYNRWIVTRFGAMTTPASITTTALFMLGTTLGIHYMIQRLNREAENARDSENAQLAANKALRNLQIELEERVELRTAELQAANAKMKAQLQQIKHLQAKLREEAIRDPLTGLFNRRYLNETLAREFARAQRGNYAISFMLLDIDHFKIFNDLYGHATGDIVLKTLASRLNSRIRTADIPCRMGGEEFLLVLPGVAGEVAQVRAEYLRDQIQTMPIPYDNETLSLTVSIGISCYPKSGETWEELYQAVDQALYRAKQNGRNRVECA
ncbi:MAG: diguanylate cyclase [Anaerolineales bacterium]